MNTGARAMKVVLCSLASILLLAGAARGRKADTETLTNDTIVKMCSLGLSEDVVIAKINQAEAVSFKLDSDNLLELKDKGVSQPVIVAMLNRSARGQGAPPPGGEIPPAGAASPPALVPVFPPAPAVVDRAANVSSGKVSVQVIGSGAGAVELVPGEVAGTSASVFVPFRRVIYLHFPGIEAATRVASGRPELVLRDDVSPEGRFFLVALEPNGDKQRRALRMVSAGPHADWTVPCDVTEDSPGQWRLHPRKILGAGEYGLLGPGAVLREFGVDEPLSGEPAVIGTETVEFAKSMQLDLPLPPGLDSGGKGSRSGVDVTEQVRRYRCDRVSFSRLSVEERRAGSERVEYRVRGRLIKPRKEELLLRVASELVCGGQTVASSPLRLLAFEDDAASDVPWSASLEAPRENAGGSAGCLIRLRIEVSES